MMLRGVLLLALLLPPALPAQRSLAFGARVHPDVAVRLWMPAGSVRVECWDRDSIDVAGRVAAGAHFFGGASPQGAKLGVEADDALDGTLARGDLVVRVPRRARLWIKMTQGDVRVRDSDGELEVITVAGDIDVQGGSGVVSVETIDARVLLARLRGPVRVRGGSGALRLVALTGTLTAASIGGAVDLALDGLPRARVETITGAIRLHGTPRADADLTLDTHSGPVTLSLPATMAPALVLTSRDGAVRNALGTGSARHGRIEARSFRGTIDVVPVGPRPRGR